MKRLWYVGYCLFLLLISFKAEPASLKVSPAGFIIHNLTPGKVYNLHQETGLRLTIYNDDEVSHRYTVSVHRPSEVGRWEKGYSEIPDSKWCWFEEKEISVEPKGKGYANLAKLANPG